MPEPFLVRPKPEPEIMPPTVKLPALTVMVREAFIVTFPVPIFRSFVPVKAKSPFQLCVLLLVRVFELPLVLLSDPETMVKAVVPRAVALLSASVPLLSVEVPAKVLAPLRASVPAPSLVMPVEPPVMFDTVPLIVVVPLVILKVPALVLRTSKPDEMVLFPDPVKVPVKYMLFPAPEAWRMPSVIVMEVSCWV